MWGRGGLGTRCLFGQVERWRRPGDPDIMENPASLAPAARLLGYAGLLPLIGCAAGLGLVPMHRAPLLDAGFGYAALIFSFLGGLWWGQGIARGKASPALFTIAVLPSLVAWGLMLLRLLGWTTQEALLVLGAAILLSPVVDLALARKQATVYGWIALRLQLSTGLGALTLALAIL